MDASPRRRSRESFAERRERKAEIDDPEVVLEAAARFLEARSRSIAEVRRRLTRTGYRGELVEGAIERLVALGILDDRAFAEAWVASRDRAHPRGERALRQELALKGIDRAIVDGLLEERREGEDPEAPQPDLAAAGRLLTRNARTLERVRDPRQRRSRAYALLVRNGFDSETCTTAVRAWLEANDTGEDPDEGEA
jgi:regulatory protein